MRSNEAESLEACGFAIRAQIVWAKDRLGLERGHYHWQHEPYRYAVKGAGHWARDVEGGSSCAAPPGHADRKACATRPTLGGYPTAPFSRSDVVIGLGDVWLSVANPA